MLRLRLRCRALSQLLPPPSSSPISQLLGYHSRLLSAAAPVVSPNPSFAVEDYLVSTCGLTRAQALKASPKLAHLRSPANPDAVLAFLAGRGLSGADVAALVAKDPKFLCTKVDKGLSPIVAGLSGVGLSDPEMARLLSLAPDRFRCRSIVPNIHYCLCIFVSYENLLSAVKRNFYILTSNLERVIKPNVAALREFGLGPCAIAKLCLAQPWLLTCNVECVRATAVCVQGLGIPRGSGMFRHALSAVAFVSEEKIAAKVEHLKKTFRWSDAEVGIAISKAPNVLNKTKEFLQRRSEFLISDLGLEPAYIAHRPVMLSYSLEGRLRPRSYVVKFLKANGLLDPDRDLYSVLVVTEKVFMERFT
ncbi:transcription termination factor MTERF4, chloroplastic isoform X2 [Triticum aestivum]|uniref:transcription termination factor MTERF4, chloroplastic isoform X2 n=1 Tax=Triticum aestivum TaxID=4565 RepID=UPI001D00CBDB|nr:transcription termination factor MTERF4, chloroplastic-like isoform X2 [Triticum aestivum]